MQFKSTLPFGYVRHLKGNNIPNILIPNLTIPTMPRPGMDLRILSFNPLASLGIHTVKRGYIKQPYDDEESCNAGYTTTFPVRRYTHTK